MSEEKIGKNVWVVTHGEQWGVRLEGNKKPSKLFDRKEDALKYAKNRAQEEKSELISQKRNGQINLKNSYGHDDPNVKG
ncbi:MULTISPECIES: DUF2188 domain-containing protein [unclassified Lactobacillus]|uniref:DUF2188 domain-containing protein n=1 Tax=unclassified Lactobacillus TaxID=2620435 RepID=UPI001F169C42|nr:MULTISPECIES: DUF2188 domain-containing protein [unclassified Lactobacillus]